MDNVGAMKLVMKLWPSAGFREVPPRKTSPLKPVKMWILSVEKTVPWRRDGHPAVG
jgi:hypothetical protein